MAPPYTWIVNPHEGPPPARLVQEVPAMAVEQTSGPRRGGRSNKKQKENPAGLEMIVSIVVPTLTGAAIGALEGFARSGKLKKWAELSDAKKGLALALISGGARYFEMKAEADGKRDLRATMHDLAVVAHAYAVTYLVMSRFKPKGKAPDKAPDKKPADGTNQGLGAMSNLSPTDLKALDNLISDDVRDALRELLAERAQMTQRDDPQPQPTVGELGVDEGEMSLDELARSFGLGELNLDD